MSIYAGVRCLVCNKKFTAGDDIVVCPICGAPHHRECYRELGQCAFQDGHLTGKEWSARPEQESAETATGDKTRICTRCNAANPADGIFCGICGHMLAQSDPVSRPEPDYRDRTAQTSRPGGHSAEIPGPGAWVADRGVEYEYDRDFFTYGGLSPDEVVADGVTAREMASYIGPSSGYYLPRFKHINEGGSSLSFNLSALLFNFFYFFYRKMYLLGAILLALYFVRMIPVFLYTQEIFPLLAARYGWTEVLEQFGVILSQDVDMVKAGYYENMNRYANYIGLLINLVVSLCANRFYFDKAMGALQGIRRVYGEPQVGDARYISELSRAGGCSRAAVVVATIGVYLVLFFIALLIILGGW